MELKNINNNILSSRWKKRYAEQPLEIQQKLDALANARIKEYQLQVIKKEKIYPQIGDIFEINPQDDIFLYGIVVNNHIKNINGEDLLLIFIFREKDKIRNILNYNVRSEDLLIPPQMVGKEYWTKGYFNNIDFMANIESVKGYGFYSVGKGKYFDEYGSELNEEPELLGTYGVATISGIARVIQQELIISRLL